MILEVEDAGFFYTAGTPIFSHISFSVPEKSIVTVLGQNGRGKTTLLKCIAGLRTFTSGRLLLDGKEASTNAVFSEERPIVYVPQMHSMAFPYTAEEVVLMGRARFIGAFSSPSKQDRKVAERIMERVGVLQFRDMPCTNLSGGQLQLVCIARALAAEPQILLLDEPESHLDFKNQFRILRLIKSLVTERGISCLMNTHFPDYALRLSDSSLLMGKGKSVFGPTRDLINAENIRDYFGVETEVIRVPDRDMETLVILEKLEEQTG
ncbi:ABC transporter ATP-binding protein [Selenomonas sputigena]|uniref:ABC transporter ATP-binding protein n=1 Tax=Selenomonas sputigena TaxID=69823 RepID=A0ABV3X1K8_9FIRM